MKIDVFDDIYAETLYWWVMDHYDRSMHWAEYSAENYDISLAEFVNAFYLDDFEEYIKATTTC